MRYTVLFYLFSILVGVSCSYVLSHSVYKHGYVDGYQARIDYEHGK